MKLRSDDIGKYKLLLERQRGNVMMIVLFLQFVIIASPIVSRHFWTLFLVPVGMVVLVVMVWVDVKWIMPRETGYWLYKNQEWQDLRKQLDEIEKRLNENN